MRSWLAPLFPFLCLGTMLALVIVGIVLFSYLLIFGAIMGSILFIIAWIKSLVIQRKPPNPPILQPKTGRIIDHDDV
jgi:hypothetical protein